MKRFLKVFIIIVSLFSINSVYAETLHNLEMVVYLDKEGTAHFNETWDYTSTSSDNHTEIYHGINDFDLDEISFIKASDSTNKEYTLMSWNPKNTFDQKTYRYGINKNGDTIELCMGISHYGRYKYTFNYEIKNFIKTLKDAQILYYEFWPNNGIKVNKYSITIYSYYSFSDSLDVWGYGDYGATAYVHDGKIYSISQSTLNEDEYITLLAKFPLNTFTNIDYIDKSFDDVLTEAEKGTQKYNKTFHFITDFISSILARILSIAPFILLVVVLSKSSKNSKFSNKIVDKKYLKKDEYNMFRELPFEKEIDLAYFIAAEYKLTKNKNDYFGAILLKWVKNGNVEFINSESKILKKETHSIKLINAPLDELEAELYGYMVKAAKDDLLEEKEFTRYCSNHYSTILKWFDKVLDKSAEKLEGKKLLIQESKKKAFGSTKYNTTPELNEKVTYMYGLKKFFEEFKNMEDKRVIDVHLWEEYLMYAQIFGVAKEVAQEFKNIYPEFISDQQLNTFIYIHHFSYTSVNAASIARSNAMSYVAGGGGFSSGGGGGGSFGGGGGAGGR